MPLQVLLALLIIPFNVFAQLQFGTSKSLDIITWNVEWFPKEDQITLNQMIPIIEELDADIIAFQEINSVSYFYQLADSLENYSAYSTGTSGLNLSYFYKTSLEVDSIYTIFDSNDYNFAGRPPLILRLNYQSEDYYIINNHFKCCGNGQLDLNDSGDEEFRRFQAMNFLKSYIDQNLANDKVIILGDLNDLIEDPITNNVFSSILNDSLNYMFADKYIPSMPSNSWSFPNWPSHLDHIIISNELFEGFDIENDIQTIRLDIFLGSFQAYDNYISDHLPVGINIRSKTANIQENNNSSNKKLKYSLNFKGQIIIPELHKPHIDVYNDGSYQKKIILE
ncbi:MAG: endonuclease/exonuclease/phosphatase family protein [Flavobacteriales bacterium]